MIESMQDLRDLLEDLQQVAGLSGFDLQASSAEREPGRLDSPDQVRAMLGELLVDALGMEVGGL